MSRIRKYTCVELFAGAGGLALGAERAGFEHLLLNEFNPDACSTLRRNRPNWNIVEKNIQELTFSERPDVVFGGPPCQAFSVAGKRKALNDLRGTMVFEFLRVIQEMQPKVAVMENVEGLIHGPSSYVLDEILRQFQEMGWTTFYRLLNASHFGVPQNRKRLFLIATQKKHNLPTLFPIKDFEVITVEQALKDCPVSIGASYSDKKKEILDFVPPGGNWKSLPEDIRKRVIGKMSMKGGNTGVSQRLAWDQPSPTLLCSPIQNFTERCHPGETRPLTVREYARIQTFPDDWEFQGSMLSQYKQIGNAVPVVLGFRIAEAVAAMLDKVIDPDRFEQVGYLDLW